VDRGGRGNVEGALIAADEKNVKGGDGFRFQVVAAERGAQQETLKGCHRARHLQEGGCARKNPNPEKEFGGGSRKQCKTHKAKKDGEGYRGSAGLARANSTYKIDSAGGGWRLRGKGEQAYGAGKKRQNVRGKTPKKKGGEKGEKNGVKIQQPAGHWFRERLGMSWWGTERVRGEGTSRAMRTWWLFFGVGRGGETWGGQTRTLTGSPNGEGKGRPDMGSVRAIP